MKYTHITSVLILVALLAVACSAAEPAETESSDNSVSKNGNGSGVEDFDSLREAFEDLGARTEVGGSITQPFFSVEAQMIAIDGADVQVFEYPNEEAADADAALVSSDGSSVGTSMPFWVDTPHFFKSGQLIVLYIGSDAGVITTLESILGPQFAGR